MEENKEYFKGKWETTEDYKGMPAMKLVVEGHKELILIPFRGYCMGLIEVDKEGKELPGSYLSQVVGLGNLAHMEVCLPKNRLDKNSSMWSSNSNWTEDKSVFITLMISDVVTRLQNQFALQGKPLYVYVGFSPKLWDYSKRVMAWAKDNAKLNK